MLSRHIMCELTPPGAGRRGPQELLIGMYKPGRGAPL
jgi:hypothetical protein